MQLPRFSLLLPLVSLAAGQAAPPNLASLFGATDSLSSLTKLVSGFPELLATLGNATNITILAPNNEAFKVYNSMEQTANVTQDQLKALLSYHVLNGTYGSSSFDNGPKFLPTLLGDFEEFRNLSGAPQVVKAVDDPAFYGGLGIKVEIEEADIEFAGGLVHIISGVLPPPMNVSTTAVISNLTSLAGALKEVDLVDTVDRLAGVTIFAPTNAAFQAIGNLLPNLTTEQITEILTYHVVAGEVVYSTLLKDGAELDTVNGKKLTIVIEDDDVFVNGARVIIADVLTNNGVVHVIDGVLNPNATDDTPDPSASTQSPAFPSATRVPGEPFTSSTPDATSSGTTTTGASPSETGGVAKLGVSALLAAGAGIFAFGMIA